MRPKLNVNIVHPSLNVHGGAELVCLEMIKIFKINKYKVNLYTIDKINYDLIARSYGDHIKADNSFYLTNQQVGTKASLVRLFYFGYLYVKLLLLSKKTNELTINNFGDVLPIIADFSFIHSVPLFSLWADSNQNPYQIRYWRVISKIYYLAFYLLKSMFGLSTIITNSHYNAEIIRNSILKNPFIVYPPIKFHSKGISTNVKREMVITVSRINKMKNLEIIPQIAALMRNNGYFSILGRVYAHSKVVIETITKRAEMKGASKKIKIIGDPERSMIEDAYSVASIYLSTQPTEAFGVAIVEAIMHGCVPITPRMGGPWVDILEEKQGWFGFGYSSAQQAALFIQLLFSNEAIRNKISERAKNIAMSCDIQVFNKKMIQLTNLCLQV